MGGDTSITGIKYKELQKWMRKNYWVYVGKNSQNHDVWEYNLEKDGEYLRDILSQAGGIIIIDPEPVNSHVEGGVLREYTVKSIYEYMGLSKKEFINSYRNGKKYADKTLITKFKETRDHYNLKYKKN